MKVTVELIREERCFDWVKAGQEKRRGCGAYASELAQDSNGLGVIGVVRRISGEGFLGRFSNVFNTVFGDEFGEIWTISAMFPADLESSTI